MSYLGILSINTPNCVTGDVESVLVRSNRLDLHCTALFSFFLPIWVLQFRLIVELSASHRTKPDTTLNTFTDDYEFNNLKPIHFLKVNRN